MTWQPSQPVQPGQPKPKPLDPFRRHKVWTAIGGVFIVVCAIGAISNAVSGSSSDGKTIVEPASFPTEAAAPTVDQLRFEADGLCHDRVKLRLKAPDTAKWDTTKTSTVGNPIFTVTGKVSAQNSFGALVQSFYYCTVTYRSTVNGQDRFKIKTGLL